MITKLSLLIENYKPTKTINYNEELHQRMTGFYLNMYPKC